MSRLSPSSPDAGVFDALAQRLRQMVRDEHRNSGSGAERFTVQSVSPLRLNELSGDLVLEDGDPDLTVDRAVRSAVTAGQVSQGDLVWVLREHQEWHVIGLVQGG